MKEFIITITCLHPSEPKMTLQCWANSMEEIRYIADHFIHTIGPYWKVDIMPVTKEEGEEVSA